MNNIRSAPKLDYAQRIYVDDYCTRNAGENEQIFVVNEFLAPVQSNVEPENRCMNFTVRTAGSARIQVN